MPQSIDPSFIHSGQNHPQPSVGKSFPLEPYTRTESTCRMHSRRKRLHRTSSLHDSPNTCDRCWRCAMCEATSPVSNGGLYPLPHRCQYQSQNRTLRVRRIRRQKCRSNTIGRWGVWTHQINTQRSDRRGDNQRGDGGSQCCYIISM